MGGGECSFDEAVEVLDEGGAGDGEVAAGGAGFSKDVRLGVLAVGEDGQSGRSLAGGRQGFAPGDFGLQVEDEEAGGGAERLLEGVQGGGDGDLVAEGPRTFRYPRLADEVCRYEYYPPGLSHSVSSISAAGVAITTGKFLYRKP